MRIGLWLTLVISTPARSLGSLQAVASLRSPQKEQQLTIPKAEFSLKRSSESPLTTILLDSKLLLAAAVPLVVAIFQGAWALCQFRKVYAQAPLPKLPAHGLVLAKPFATKRPLKVLVIGDSLAVGVGQSHKATPVLPQALAWELSRATRRGVFWTTFGETGASTPWIIRMIKHRNLRIHENYRYEEYPVEGTIQNQTEVSFWKKQLGEYQNEFRKTYLNPKRWNAFDVVVLFTGVNDLKSIIFPFLLDPEDKELRRQHEDGSIITNIKLLWTLLKRKMKTKSLLAMPGSPARLVPHFRQAPLEWFARPVFDSLDSLRKDLADEHDDLVYVDNPSLADAIAYEKQPPTRETWLCLQAIATHEKDSLEAKMKRFYQHEVLTTKPGARLFSSDGIHPNEAGYDMWGKLNVS